VILRIPIAGAVALVLLAGLLYDFLQHRMASPLLAFGVHPEVVDRLEDSLDDQRELARRDPQRETVYHDRFTSLSALVRRLYVLDYNRDRIAHRYQQIVFTVFGGLVVAVAGAFVWQRQRQDARLARLREALAALADGRTDIRLADRRRDTLGKIARMIEQTSQLMARDRKRLAALRNLSAWQEAARRHAHEMKTPLTGAKLELGRLAGLLETESLARGDEIHQAARSAGQEIERLGAFTRQFTSFARLPRPEKRRWDLARLLDDFVTTFALAWPNLALVFALPAEPVEAEADRDMLRQVLVNLCDNSSLALGDRKGRAVFDVATERESVLLRVADDGPGVAREVRRRLFEPYTTTRKIGHGMGLGLAISKKILLDHGGDLELEATSDEGTTFRITLPSPSREGGSSEEDET
jgi:nitrogen fixation/metabolism regulation signal transduction histidine kinase